MPTRRNIIGKGLPKFGPFAEERLKKRETHLATADLLETPQKKPVCKHAMDVMDGWMQWISSDGGSSFT
jgi:hypothetical protein